MSTDMADRGGPETSECVHRGDNDGSTYRRCGGSERHITRSGAERSDHGTLRMFNVKTFKLGGRAYELIEDVPMTHEGGYCLRPAT